jgi:hypothetical protein
MTSAARKITDTQTLGKYVEWHIFIVSNLCPYAPYLFRIAKVINLSVYPPFSVKVGQPAFAGQPPKTGEI